MKIILFVISLFAGATAWYGHCLGKDEEWQKEKAYWRDYFND